MSEFTSHPPADEAARKRALDISQSFIVRAPAGSGKTRLLVQRYLALLARVDEPEEIVAITFTRKAAAEMKQRVCDALNAASADDGTEDDDTRRLAVAALAHSEQRGWQILASGSRLRMQTIDSLNASITRQMPLLARFGAQPESVDDASLLYADAARHLLVQVNDGGSVADDVATLLSHLDNDMDAVEKLLAGLLRTRDHWLRNLKSMHEREMLEATLARIRAQAVNAISTSFPAALKNETLELARFAGQKLAADGVDSGLCIFVGTPAPLGANTSGLPAWLALADFLLTKEGKWRKRVDKRQGFPTSNNREEKAVLSEQKNRMLALLESLAGDEFGFSEANALSATLHQLRSLPSAAYSEEQWRILGAIARLLPHATAALWHVFGQQGQCDFTEISQAASRALGEEDAPTDLALALDYRISHLLIDEFQDTSFAQFELLEKLTRGWNPSDGRTLFLVGDPMQSIYRFREAEVSLFSRAWREGVGGVRLNPLTLSVNFRSTAGLLEWVNNTFQAIMPSTEDDSIGAVPFASSVAFTNGEAAPDSSRPAVVVHPFFAQKHVAKAEIPEVKIVSSGEVAEAAKVVDIIAATQHEKPDAVVAILVRNRGHLRAIVPALKAANIACQAVDIDPLKERPIVRDLLALTRAMMHLADRIAWLAILRAPWCGLRLDDLAHLTAGAFPVDGLLAPDARTIWELLNDVKFVASMSADGQTRAKTFCDALAPALRAHRRLQLRESVEHTWLRLRGPAAVTREEDLDDAARLFELLDAELQSQARGGQLIDLGALDARVERLFAGVVETTANTGGPPVQIMTIHKSKGLEFDTVIVPGLHRVPRRDDRQLIVWSEQPNPDTGEPELLLAPIKETGAEATIESDSIYQYVLQQEREKQRHEHIRLIYVAATRAERQLHVLGEVVVRRDADGSESVVPPRTESLLASLWPAVSSIFKIEADLAISKTAASATVQLPIYPRGPMRIASTQPLPMMPAAISTGVADERQLNVLDRASIDFEWASDTARHIGSVVHEFLQHIAEEGVKKWDRQRIGAASTAVVSALRRRGVAANELSLGASRVVEALGNTLADARGNWILQKHHQARAEWRLTGMREGALLNIAIDRTFIDDEGVRWIIDFKTGDHDGADVQAFLDNERRRYGAQLETYARIFSAMQIEPPPKAMKLGLYFPMLRGWREWAWESAKS